MEESRTLHHLALLYSCVFTFYGHLLFQWFDVDFFECISLAFTELLQSASLFLIKFSKFSDIIPSKNCSAPTFFSSATTAFTSILELLIFSHRSLRLCTFFFNDFAFYFPHWVIYIILYSLSISFVISILLLSQPSEFSNMQKKNIIAKRFSFNLVKMITCKQETITTTTVS